MPRGSASGSRRVLVCLVLVLAAVAISVWNIAGASGEGGAVTPNGGVSVVAVPTDKDEPPDTTGSSDVKGGEKETEGVIGEDIGAKASPVGEAEDAARGKAAAPAGGGEGDKGKEGGGRGGGDVEEIFSLKVGQVQVVPSTSLDFSTEDGHPGLLWLPIGLREVGTGDPWVTMCLMDYGYYQKNPSQTPMYTHLNNFSKCGHLRGRSQATVSAGKVEIVRMSSLMQSMKDQGREPLPPKGFVYHETRCGSTLVANMLASLPPSRVFSESKPPTQTLRECYADGCDRETMIRVFRNTMALMGRRRNNEQHQHLYFKFQNSKYINEISEAYPDVPWVFVFRDPVEVMVSNLKSLAGAPCVRIPRQEKLRQATKTPKKSQHLMLAGGGGLHANLGAGGGDGGVGKGRGGKARRLRRSGGGGRGEDGATSEGGGEVQEDAKIVVVRGGEDGGSSRGGDAWDVFGSVSWNGEASGEFDLFGVPQLGLVRPSSGLTAASTSASVSAAYASADAPTLYGGSWVVPRRGSRRLPAANARQPAALTMNMSVECADWLQVMCVFALDAEKSFPSKALFVDYANLPEAVPEHVFPEHFGMAKELDEAVPDWRERMMEAAGSYSKGIGKTKSKNFHGDVELKHKQASPFIVKASKTDGGLYDLYHSLDDLQTWRRPES